MYQAIVFLPLIGALIAGLAGTSLFRMMGRESEAFAAMAPDMTMRTTMAIMAHGHDASPSSAAMADVSDQRPADHIGDPLLGRLCRLSA